MVGVQDAQQGGDERFTLNAPTVSTAADLGPDADSVAQQSEPRETQLSNARNFSFLRSYSASLVKKKHFLSLGEAEKRSACKLDLPAASNSGVLLPTDVSVAQKKSYVFNVLASTLFQVDAKCSPD